MASNVIAVFTPHLPVFTPHLLNPFATHFERNLRSVSNYDSVKSITILGHGTNRNNFVYSKKIFVEFESSNAALITKLTSMRILNFEGYPINILGYESFMENLKIMQPRWNYDSLQYVRICRDSVYWRLEKENFIGNRNVTNDIGLFAVISATPVDTNNGVSNFPRATYSVTNILNANNNNLYIGKRESDTSEHSQFVKNNMKRILNQCHFNEDFMKNFIKNKLTPSDTEDFAMSDTYVLKLICPITRKRLINPARGFDCLHIESFELESFIKLNILKMRWECPICKNEAPINKLGLDKYLMNILNECKDEQVEINKESKWVAIDINNNVKKQTSDNFYDLTKENENETIYLSDDSLIEKSLSQNKNSNLACLSQKHLQPNNIQTSVQTIQTHIQSQQSQVFKQHESLISRLNDKENQTPAVPNSRPQSSNNKILANRLLPSSHTPLVQSINMNQRNFQSSFPHLASLNTDHEIVPTTVPQLASLHINFQNTLSTVAAPLVQTVVENSICEICQRKFKTDRGKKQHIRLSHK